MDRGFNLTIENHKYVATVSDIEKYRADGKNRAKILADLWIKNDKLDASLITEHLFPIIEADIFLSHSSKDIGQAVGIAQELESCGLKVFIDSFAWGSVYELLRTIDNKHCLSDDGSTYDYHERNRSTSHIYMILSTALQRMIDNTDTILFLNTNHSISLKDSVESESKTLSPWIHMELSFSSMVRRRPRRLRINNKRQVLDGVVSNEGFDFSHEAPVWHFTKINEQEFEDWLSYAFTNKSEAIDYLYKNFNRT